MNVNVRLTLTKHVWKDVIVVIAVQQFGHYRRKNSSS